MHEVRQAIRLIASTNAGLEYLEEVSRTPAGLKKLRYDIMGEGREELVRMFSLPKK